MAPRLVFSQSTPHGDNVLIHAGVKPGVAPAGAVVEVQGIGHQGWVVPFPHQLHLPDLECS